MPLKSPARATDPAGTRRALGSSRRGDPQARVAVDEVGEAGCEAAEADPPRRAGVGADHLVAGQSGEVGDLVEVGPVVAHGDLDDDLAASAGGRPPRSGGSPRRGTSRPTSDRRPGSRSTTRTVRAPTTRWSTASHTPVARSTRGARWARRASAASVSATSTSRAAPPIGSSRASTLSPRRGGSRRRTARAPPARPAPSPPRPGVSPWMHTDSARTSTSVPSTAVTRPVLHEPDDAGGHLARVVEHGSGLGPRDETALAACTRGRRRPR